MPESQHNPTSVRHVSARLFVALALLVTSSGCSLLRRWLVPPQTHADANDIGYGHDRSSRRAEMILVVSELPGGATSETAIAVRDGHILARGTTAEMDSYRDDTTRTIRLPGGVATAGLVAGHVRLEMAAMASDTVDLRGCKTIADVVNVLKIAKPLVLTESGWLWADGLQPSLFAKLTTADLDRAIGRTSVLVTPEGESAALANGSLLAHLGELGNEIANHGGRLDDRQIRLAWQQLPPARAERLKPLLLAVFANLQRQGVTEVHAFAASQSLLEALHMLDRDSRLTVRTHVFLDAERPEGRALLNARPSPTTQDPQSAGAQSPPQTRTKRVPLVQVSGVSLELDGGIASGTAALAQKYADLPYAGTLTYSDETLTERLQAADRAGVQVAVRASGDAALAQLARVVTALQRTRDAPQLRVELPEVVSPDTLEVLHASGALCVVAPVTSSHGLDVARHHLGASRMPWFDRAASLAAACPLQVALDYAHPEALRAHDRLTRHNTVDPEAMTSTQAWRALSSGGTARTNPPVQVGEDADLVIWSRDPLAPGKTPAKVIASMVGGTVTLLIGRETNSD